MLQVNRVDRVPHSSSASLSLMGGLGATSVTLTNMVHVSSLPERVNVRGFQLAGFEGGAGGLGRPKAEGGPGITIDESRNLFDNIFDENGKCI